MTYTTYTTERLYALEAENQTLRARAEAAEQQLVEAKTDYALLSDDYGNLVTAERDEARKLQQSQGAAAILRPEQKPSANGLRVAVDTLLQQRGHAVLEHLREAFGDYKYQVGMLLGDICRILDINDPSSTVRVPLPLWPEPLAEVSSRLVGVEQEKQQEPTRDWLLKRCGWYASELDTLTAQVAQLQKEKEPAWRPIETAPMDGTEVWLTDGHWKRSGWWARRIKQWSIDTIVSLSAPTHWMPLPAHPTQESSR